MTACHGTVSKQRAMSLSIEIVVPPRAAEAAALTCRRQTPSESDLPGAAESSRKTGKRETAGAHQLRTNGLLRRPHSRWHAPYITMGLRWAILAGVLGLVAASTELCVSGFLNSHLQRVEVSQRNIQQCVPCPRKESRIDSCTRAVRLGKLVLPCRSSARVGMGSPVNGRKRAGCKPQPGESWAFHAARHFFSKGRHQLHGVKAGGTSQRDVRQEGGLADLWWW